MAQIFMLALAPIRKKKGQTISLLALLLIASVLLYIGLLISLNISGFFDTKAKENNSADIVVLIEDTIFSEDDVTWFRDNPKVRSVETIEARVLPEALIDYTGGSRLKTTILLDEKKPGRMLSPRLVGKTLPTDESNAAYLPYMFHSAGGFELGDTFSIKYDEKTYALKVCGFFEEVNLGFIYDPFIGVILPNYDAFIDELFSWVNCSVLLIRADKKTAVEISQDYEYEKSMRTNSAIQVVNVFRCLNIIEAGETTMVTLTMVAALLILLALLIVLVTLVMTYSRITDSIEDDIVNIGILKAIGYRSRQIINSILLQFLIISLAGCMLGITASYVISPMLFSSFATQSGLIWDKHFDITAMLITVIVMTVAVSFISLSATKRVKKLHPTMALNGAASAGGFKRNRFQLDKADGPLHLLLALKNLKLKQSARLVLVCAVTSFVSILFIILYYNTNIEPDNFLDLVAPSYADWVITPKGDSDEAELQQLFSDINHVEGVEEAVFYCMQLGFVNKRFTVTYVTDDYSKLTLGGFVYEGRSPETADEISVGGTLAQSLGKKIGDRISFDFQGGTAEYEISGFGQGVNGGGWAAEFTTEGIKRMNPNYKPSMIYVFKQKDVSLQDLQERLESKFGSRVDNILGAEENKLVMAPYFDGIAVFTAWILLVALLTIILAMFIVIKAYVLRHRYMLGVQKGIGFTTLQLMHQIAVSFMIPVVFGLTLGCIVGAVYTNPFFDVLFSFIGFVDVNFTVLPVIIIMVEASMALFAYIAAMVISWDTRSISAHTLMSN